MRCDPRERDSEVPSVVRQSMGLRDEGQRFGAGGDIAGSGAEGYGIFLTVILM